MKFVSIIIPTYNRAHLIGITLDSLLAIDYPSDAYEILVVDNNSNDHTAEVVKSYEHDSSGLIRYFFEPKQGSHFARNNVVKFAKGELLYFTDDDMIADQNLLRCLVEVFNDNPQVATATGRVLPKWETEPPFWVKKYCSNGWLSLYDNENDFFITNDDFGVFSCHQMVRKELFVDAGGYNPDIVNGEWLGDNETGLNIKLKNAGAKFAFARKSLTWHIIPATRMTQSYLNKRFANQGNCDCYTDYRTYRYTEKELKRQNLQFRKLRFYKIVKYIGTKLLNYDKWHIYRAYVDYYSAKIKYNKRLIRDKEWVEMVLINNWINI